MTAMLRMAIARDADVVIARKRIRQLAEAAGFDALSQTRLATAASELIRNAFRYAGGGTVESWISLVGARQALHLRVSDGGPGIPHLDDVLKGRYRSRTGLGQGIIAARRLSDEFRMDAPAGGGTRVEIMKYLPPATRIFDDRAALAFQQSLAAERDGDPYAEVQHQNHELLAVLDSLRERHREVERLNAELVERGVALENEARIAELARRTAAAATRAKSDFLAMMSHELRTPLGAILGYARLIEEGVGGPVTPEQQRYIERIAAAQRHLLGLIDEILSFAKLDSGTLPMALGPVPMNALVSLAHGMIAPQLAARGLEYTGGPVPDGLAALADRDKLTQIVVNLLSNALKFTPAGGSIAVNVRDAGGMVSLSVTDTGRGIPPERLEEIFEPFVQVERSALAAGEGVGLGLAISRALARAMGGDLTATSVVGAGSCFTLTIPRG